MSKGQVTTEFEWLSSEENESEQKAAKFHFLKEGYLFMTEEESDHLPHGVYTSKSPTAGAGGERVVGGAHAVLVRRTSDPSIKVRRGKKQWTFQVLQKKQ